MTHHYSRTAGSISEPVLYLLALTARPGGVRCGEVAERFMVALPHASAMLGRQVRAGRVMVDKSEGYQCSIYRAIDPAQWSGFPIPPSAPAGRPIQSFPKRDRKRKPLPSQHFRVVTERDAFAASVTIKAQPDRTPSGDALVMAPDVKITRAPGWTHDPRFQLPPGVQPYGAGFSAVGVGRDVETGKGWGA